MELQRDRIRAIAIDLDGTVLGADSKLSARTLRALRGCVSGGLRVIIATGRCMASSEEYRAAIGADGPMVYYNGAVTLDMPSRKTLDKHTIGRAVVSCCADIARAENTHFQTFLCGEDGGFSETLVAEKPSGETQAYTKRTGLGFTYGSLYDVLKDGDGFYCPKGIFIADEPKLRRAQRLVHERLGDAVDTMMSADTILEVLASGVSKAAGLRTALDRYRLSPAEVIAFGDEENDIKMLSMAGFSVAPSNARSSVRDTADMVIGANTDDSIARFLEETLGFCGERVRKQR
jgi:Cof subfamily protein (haloacid dehalogenase superfamily)